MLAVAVLLIVDQAVVVLLVMMLSLLGIGGTYAGLGIRSLLF